MFIVLLNRAGFKCRAQSQPFQLHIRMVIKHTYKRASGWNGGAQPASFDGAL